jgi:hypothetical protein
MGECIAAMKTSTRIANKSTSCSIEAMMIENDREKENGHNSDLNTGYAVGGICTAQAARATHDSRATSCA